MELFSRGAPSPAHEDELASTTESFAPPTPSVLPEPAVVSTPEQVPPLAQTYQPTAVAPQALAPVSTHLIQPHSKDNIHEPNPKYSLIAILSEVEIKSHIKALKDKILCRAMSDEYDAFACNDTFNLLHHSEAKNIVALNRFFILNVY